MLHGLSRRNFLQTALAGTALLTLPKVVMAFQADAISIGYIIPDADTIQYPARLKWAAPANMVGMCLEPLIRIGGENHLDYVLAHDITSDAMAKNWTIELRPSVHWQNGEPLTALQVVANIQQWMADDKSALGNQFRNFVTEVSGGVGSKPGTEIVTLKLKSPNYQFLYVFTSYAALIMHPDDNWSFSTRSRGTGPYTMVSYEASKEARFEPVADYWDYDKRAKYPVRFTQDTGALDRSLDFFPQLDPDRGAALKAEGLSIKQNPLADALIFHINCRDGELADPKVRQALRAAMDPLAMVHSLSDYARVSDHTHASTIHADYPDYPKGWVKPKIYDPDKARELLAGRKLTIPLHYQEDNIWQKNAVEAYALQAAEVGITILPTPHEAKEFNDNWGTYPGMMSTKWIHRPLAIQLYREVYYSTAEWNPSGWKNEEFDRLVDLLTATSLSDRDTISRYMIRLMQILQEDGPMIQVAWLDCSKAFNPERLTSESVIMGSGGHIYTNLLQRV